MKPVVIVGAGPAGLAVAAALTTHRVPFALLDGSGKPGGAYREIHESMVLRSPTVLNALPGLPLTSAGSYPTASELLDYLQRYASHHRLVVDRAEVSHVTRSLDVTTTAGVIAARAIIVASGMWRFPVLPTIALPATTIHSSQYRGPTAARTLVIGGGASAVEIAEEIAASGATVWMAPRRPLRFAPAHVLGVDIHHLITPLERSLPGWLARRHCARNVTLPPSDHGFHRLRAAGTIVVRAPLVRFAGDVALFADGSSLPVDRVIAATGFRFRTPFLPDEITRASEGHLITRRGRAVSWPRLHVIGQPCSVRVDSQFLRGIAHDAGVIAADVASA